MRPRQALGTTAEAAFATDLQGRILAWNRGAERVLGVSGRQAIGRCCYQLLQGRDVHGNRFCDEVCPIRNMARRKEPIRRFDVVFEPNALPAVRATVSILVLSGNGEDAAEVVHLLEPHREKADPAPASPPQERQVNSCHLTERELEVLQMLSDGGDTAQIAKLLCISPATVRNHVHNILEKLEVHTRLQAVSKALKRHLI